LSYLLLIFPYPSRPFQPPFNQWQIQDVALSAMPSGGGDNNNTDSDDDGNRRDVYYWGRVVLDRALFPPYVPRKALHFKSFPVHDACTYIFGRSSSSSNFKNKSNASTNTPRGLDADVVNLDLLDGNDDGANDLMTSSAATLIPVTRSLILSLRRHLLQSINASPVNAEFKRNEKKRRTS
jgi:hypothetical protein